MLFQFTRNIHAYFRATAYFIGMNGYPFIFYALVFGHERTFLGDERLFCLVKMGLERRGVK